MNIAPVGPDLEENFGLDLLFGLRGVRRPPADVVVVSIDRESADELRLPDDPRRWPRSFHADLVNKLHARGAAVIAFDVMFADEHSSREDRLLAAALQKSGNAILCESLKVRNILLDEEKGQPVGELNITKVMAPIDPLLASAAGTAPFPIPKVSNKVAQYWTFAAVAAEKPTLPVASFQIYSLKAYDDFITLLKRVNPRVMQRLPDKRNEISNSRGIEGLVLTFRRIFQEDDSLAEKMRSELLGSASISSDQEKRRIINALIDLYADRSNSRYLNFYGPPRTITTIPYHKMLGMSEGTTNLGDGPDVKGKAIFVGLSQLSPIDQRESFYTVYSEGQGLDLSGVEIVATAFANLKENMPVRPIDFRLYLALIFLLGTIYGLICKRFSTARSFFILGGIVTLYLIFAVFEFKRYGIWYPVITPVVFGPTTAFFAGLLWNYLEVKRERQNIRKALGFYLPDAVADRLTRNIEDIHSSHQIVFGICLSTDAEQYSSLAEMLSPQELGRFMNRYYEIIFGPIKRHDGIISDVVGDSVLAVWITPHPERVLKQQACMAALDISKAIKGFNAESGKLKLPTRIGLHSGNILLGNVGAIDHYEYRPVGDIVNTATRIEGLNKYLNTRILASEDVIGHLDGYLTRHIGEFKLAGKTKPILIRELMCRLDEADVRQIKANEVFETALSAYRKRLWDESAERFREAINILGGDGPSEFYIRLCEYNREHEPGGLWDGVINMGKK